LKSQERLGTEDAPEMPPAGPEVPAADPGPSPASAEPDMPAPRRVETQRVVTPQPVEEPPAEAAPATTPPDEIADFIDPLTQDAITAEGDAPPLPTRPPDAARSTVLAALAESAPAPQKAFIEALAKGHEAYDAAADDVAREAARADRS